MKRLFLCKGKKHGRKQKQWFVIADHFPAAQKLSVSEGLAKDQNDVIFSGDVTEEYSNLNYAGLKEKLRRRSGQGDAIVDIQTKLGKNTTRKFVDVSKPKKVEDVINENSNLVVGEILPRSFTIPNPVEEVAIQPHTATPQHLVDSHASIE